MITRTLYRLKRDFHNPDGNRKVKHDVNRIETLPKGTFVIGLKNSRFAPWVIIGHGSHPPRRALIEQIIPLLEEFPIETLADVARLFKGDIGAPTRFLEHLVSQKKITVQEYLEFLSGTDVGE
jgi:hypothetical protein